MLLSLVLSSAVFSHLMRNTAFAQCCECSGVTRSAYIAAAAVIMLVCMCTFLGGLVHGYLLGPENCQAENFFSRIVS